MTGALGVGLARGLTWDEMLRLASAAAAINVTRHGAGSGRVDAITELADRVRVVEAVVNDGRGRHERRRCRVAARPHALAEMMRRLGHEPIVVAPRDASGASAAIGRIELDHPTQVTRVTLRSRSTTSSPTPSTGRRASRRCSPPAAGSTASSQGSSSGINMGTNTGHSILHSGTVGAALTAATFGLSALAVSLAVSKPMAWRRPTSTWPRRSTCSTAPAGHGAQRQRPAPQGEGEPGPLRWAELDRFGSFRVAVAERRDAEVQLEYRARGSGTGSTRSRTRRSSTAGSPR